MMNRLRWRLLAWLWPRGESAGACANRSWSTVKIGRLEYTLTVRDTRRPDGYERTELLTMLRTVREHEAAQGWRCPDPARGGA